MWDPHEDALSILDSHGPFSSGLYRQAVVETLRGWRDVSFGARLPDGALAAVALLANGRSAESIPPSGYGGVAATRPLTAEEELLFLTSAGRSCDSKELVVRGLGSADASSHRAFLADVSIIPVSGPTAPSERYARLARRSIRRATEAGAHVVRRAPSVEEFFELYRGASKDWAMRYPEPLLARLVADGVARVDLVVHESTAVAGLLTLTADDHWMCWLAAQSRAGRNLSASYLAYDALFDDAFGADVPFINLGASVGGGSEFKGHLGAVPAPMYESRVLLDRGGTRSLTHKVLRRVSGAVSERRDG
jgi:hypothetical protein